jgi:ABC-type polysaccharide/polyol phosphate transport system ATPase subunit
VQLSQQAIVAQGVGVEYDLRLSRQRTLRATISDVMRRRRRSKGSRFWALRDVTFAARAGETFGIVGRNGSGKSTLLLTIGGILRPDTGVIRTSGRTSALLALGAGFEPDLTGRENIYLNAALLGMSRREIDDRVGDIISFSELGDFIDVPLRKYSSGMRVRLGFSIASTIEPDILLLDEVLGVGDASFRVKSQERLEDLAAKAKAIVLVSHNLNFVKEMCERVLWLNEGRVAAYGDARAVVDEYEDMAKRYRGPVRAV